MRGLAVLAIVCAPALAAAAPKSKSRPKVDAALAAAAKACGVPPARLAPTQAPTDRTGPADVDDDHGSRWWRVDHDTVTLDDNDGDHQYETRTREIASDDDGDRLVCHIDESWSRGRWHVDTVARYEGVDKIVTTFRNDRPVKVERSSAIVE